MRNIKISQKSSLDGKKSLLVEELGRTDIHPPHNQKKKKKNRNWLKQVKDSCSCEYWHGLGKNLQITSKQNRKMVKKKSRKERPSIE